MNAYERHATMLAERLMDRARDDVDLESASMLRKLGRVYAVSCEVVRARTHDQSKAAYAELVNLINGRDSNE